MPRIFFRGEYVPEPAPCPRCGGPTEYESDCKRRKPALYCMDYLGCGWTDSRSAANYLDPRGR
jgi:hypothetical protein